MIWNRLAAVLFMVVMPASARAEPEEPLIPKTIDRPPFQFGGIAEFTVGTVTTGDILFSAPFRYGYPMHAASAFWLKNSWGRVDFEEEDEFYGVPFKPPLANEVRGITYCSPRSMDGRHWARCVALLKGQPAVPNTVSENPYLVTRFAANFGNAEGGADGSSRMLRPSLDVYKEKLSVRFRVGRHSASSVELSTELILDGTLVSTLKQKARLKNGSANLVFGQGRIRVVAAGDGVTATLLTPIARGDSIIFETIRP